MTDFPFTDDWLPEILGIDQPDLSRRSVLGMLAASVCGGRSPFACASTVSTSRRIYVSPTGNDRNAGTSASPLATINGALNRFADLGAGDVIVVMPGVYNEAVFVNKGGDASANLVLMSSVRHGAKIRSPANSYSAINIVKNYVSVEGFDVQSGGTGHGIEATFLNGDSRNNGPHHILIRHNICHDSPGSGISVSYGDNYRIVNNICFRNCATNEYQGSGISVYEARSIAGVDGVIGTRIVVASNTCYANTAITLPGNVPHSDGNGIIIDDLRNTQKPNPAGAYRFKTLVENNVCYSNGGKGIHVFFSDNVTVRNNTCCYNGRDPKNPATWRAELSNVNSANTLWLNNIGVADTAVNRWNAAILDGASGGNVNRNVVWMRNLTFNGQVGAPSITQSPANPTLTALSPYLNLFGVDPLFVRGGAAEPNPDFRIRQRSPARNAGTAEKGAPRYDRLGVRRNGRGIPDIGAYEYRRL
jgi:parallel beta-helix repeat protein